MEKKYKDALIRQLTSDIDELHISEMENQGFTKKEMEDPYGEDLSDKKREKLMKKWKVFDFSKISEAVIESAKKMRETLGMEIDGGHPLTNVTCMECGVGKYRVMKLSNNLKCSKCGVIQRGYIPIPAMTAMHKDRSKIKFLFGGYGVGKTTAAINEDIEMALYMPGIKILIGTSDLKQLAAVAMLEFLTWIPESLIAKHNKTLNEITLINGSHFYFRPLYDEEKIKSLTLGRAHVIESSAIKETQQRKIFKQLQRRLRQKTYKVIPFEHNKKFQAAIKEERKTTKVIFENNLYKIDMRQIVYESNPVDDFFLGEALKAERIHAPDGEHHNYEDLRPAIEKRNPFYSTWTFPTWVNRMHLPEGILDEWRASMSDEEALIEIEGSLKTKKFGNAFKGIKYVKPFAIPRHWKRLYSTDSGKLKY